MGNTPKDGDVKTVYAVWTNTDLTEGRGYNYIEFLCECETTATRKAHSNYVMGLNSPITEVEIEFNLNKGGWIGKVTPIKPSEDDLIQEEKLKIVKEKERKLQEVIEKASSLGLDDNEIKILQDGIK